MFDHLKMARKISREFSKEKGLWLKLFGAHVRKVRESRGYSQDRVYLESGLSRATLSRVENGLVDVQIWTLARIAKIIGVSLKQLTDLKTD